MEEKYQEIETKVFRIVAVALQKKPEELTKKTSRQSEPGWDSLAQLRIIAGLEETFEIQFADHQVMGLTSLPDLTQAVIELCTANTGREK